MKFLFKTIIFSTLSWSFTIQGNTVTDTANEEWINRLGQDCAERIEVLADIKTNILKRDEDTNMSGTLMIATASLMASHTTYDFCEAQGVNQEDAREYYNHLVKTIWTERLGSDCIDRLDFLARMETESLRSDRGLINSFLLKTALYSEHSSSYEFCEAQGAYEEDIEEYYSQSIRTRKRSLNHQ